MRKHILIATVVCVLAGLVLIPTVAVRQSECWVDPVSGSIKQQTVWMFGITRGPTYRVSALETQLRATGYSWPQTWHFMGNDHYTLLNRPVEFECGSAPPIYRMEVFLDDFARTSTPEELKKFADVMQFGTEAQQKAAVDAAGAARFRR